LRNGGRRVNIWVGYGRKGGKVKRMKRGEETNSREFSSTGKVRSVKSHAGIDDEDRESAEHTGEVRSVSRQAEKRARERKKRTDRVSAIICAA
jgi:hypothetical protein